MFFQLIIFILFILYILTSRSKSESIKVWSTIFLTISVPFWFWETLIHSQWGMVIVVGIYTINLINKIKDNYLVYVTSINKIKETIKKYWGWFSGT